jgi:hypothetical protein
VSMGRLGRNGPPGQARGLAAFAVSATVVCSAAAHALAAHSFAVPWIAPDEMVYGLIGRSFWETGRLGLLGGDAPFYGLYPVLAGLPEALFGTATGIVVLQIVQALLASSAAAIVYAWARPAAGARWALAAAGLTALLPAAVYSGLLMTESSFLLTATLALWAMLRALVQPTGSRQLVVAATVLLATSARLQGVVLIPVLLTAIALVAWFARDPGFVRRFAPLLGALTALALAWLCFHLFRSGSLASPLGAYGVTTSSGYDRVAAARWVFRHAGDLFLLVLGAPLIAMLLLAYEAARGRERDPRVRALVAVTLSASVWLTLQVGVFASRYVGQLAERDLIAAVPPLLACFAVWLARGMPRPQPATSIVAALAAVPAVLLPVQTLVTPQAMPDAFMTIPLFRFWARTSADTFELVWVVAVATMVVLTVVLPRRAAPLLVALVAAAFAVTSVQAVHEIDKRARLDRVAFFGTTSTSWVNQAAAEPVTYLYEGNPFWNAVWQYAYWNNRIRWIAKLPSPTPGPVPNASAASPRSDGRLLDDRGHPLPGREVVASTAFTLVGNVVAEIHQEGIEQAGLRLWRTPGPPQLSTVTGGLRPNGDITEPVRIVVYACGHGRLELTLIGKEGTPVYVSVDGTRRLRIPLGAGGLWRGSVSAPPYANGQAPCVYRLRSAGLVGSTRIEFVRG